MRINSGDGISEHKKKSLRSNDMNRVPFSASDMVLLTKIFVFKRVVAGEPVSSG